MVAGFGSGVCVGGGDSSQSGGDSLRSYELFSRTLAKVFFFDGADSVGTLSWIFFLFSVVGAGRDFFWSGDLAALDGSKKKRFCFSEEVLFVAPWVLRRVVDRFSYYAVLLRLSAFWI